LSRPDQNLPTDAELTGPLQVQALALYIPVQEAGLISTAEWSETLGAEIEKARAAGDPADGTTYCGHVVAALERLVHTKGLLPADLLANRKRDWEDAYRRTPLGQPCAWMHRRTDQGPARLQRRSAQVSRRRVRRLYCSDSRCSRSAFRGPLRTRCGLSL
jgi:hypothetical protein